MQILFRAIIVFHAVARASRLSRAAEDLCVTPSAVSQQIQTLELHIGTALTFKAGRDIALTEAGERYFEMIGREIEHITDVTQHVRGVRSVGGVGIALESRLLAWRELRTTGSGRERCRPIRHARLRASHLPVRPR